MLPWLDITNEILQYTVMFMTAHMFTIVLHTVRPCCPCQTMQAVGDIMSISPVYLAEIAQKVADEHVCCKWAMIYDATGHGHPPTDVTIMIHLHKFSHLRLLLCPALTCRVMGQNSPKIACDKTLLISA